MIFPDGSEVEIDESDLKSALAAGAKQSSNGTMQNQKSTSMVFPDGSIADISEGDIGGAMKAGAIKKKGGSSGIVEEPNITSTFPVPTTFQSPSKEDNFVQPDIITNPYGITKKPVVNVAGVNVPLSADLVAPIPLATNAPYDQNVLATELQQRINTKTYSPDDVAIVAQSMNVSPTAANAYMDGNIGTGTVIHFNDIKKTKQDQLKVTIDKANKDLGLSDSYDEVFATPELASAYIDKIQSIYSEKAQSEIENKAQQNGLSYIPSGASGSGFAPIIAEATAIREGNTNAAQQLKAIVSNDIIDQVSNDNSLNTDQKVKKIYNLVDSRDKANVEKAIDKRLSPLRYMVDVAIGGNTTQDIDLLNANKAGIEFKVNQTLQDKVNYNTALKKSIAEEYAAKVDSQEISAEDGKAKEYYGKRLADIDAENTHIATQIVPNTTLYDKYPVLYKTAIANAVNEFNAIKSGNVQGYEDGGYENTSLAEHLTANGFDVKDQKVQDFLSGDNFKDYSFHGRPLRNVIDVFTNTGKSLLDFTPLRDDATILAEKKQAELFPTQVGAQDEFQLTGSASTAQTIANTTGQIIGQGLLQAGTAGLGRMMGLSKVAAMNGAFWSSGTLTSYDQAYKDSYDFVDSDVGRTAYAGLIALANGASEKIFPEVKIFQIPGVKDAAANIAKKVGTKEFTHEVADELLGKAKNAFVDYATKYGKNVGQETVEEVATDLFESGTRFLFGDPNINSDKAIESATNTAIQTAIGTSVIGGVGAHRDVQQERNVSAKSTIYNAAIYHDEALDAINLGFEANLYDTYERDAKVAVLQTARQSVDILNKTEKIEGKELKRPERELYVANLTAEATLTAQKKGMDEVGQKSIDEKISNLQNQRQQILKGEVLIDDNGNISMPKEIVVEPVVPSVAVSDTEILSTLEKVKQVIPEENLVATQDILTRVNNAENINVNEIETAQNELYSALDAAPEAAHLIEPLILKLQDYEFATKTEVGTVTEERAVETTRPVVKKQAVNNSISQWEGNRATITDSDGNTVEGVINLEDGKYSLKNENGEKVASLGETAITDRDITLPTTESVPTPIQFDENGDIKSMTLQLNKVDKENGGIVPDKLITINFRDKEKALDYAIQLRAEQVGDYPQPEFDVAYEQVQREIKTEVPITKPVTPITNEGTTGQINETIPTNEGQPTGQGTEATVPKSVAPVKQTPTTTAVTVPVVPVVTTSTAPVVEKSFSTKARDLAAKIRRNGITPDFLKISDPNVKISGISDKQVSEALARAIEFVADAVDAGTELAKAISDGFKEFKKVYTDNSEPFDEPKIKAGFETYVKTQFSEPDIKEIAESIRKDDISYNDVIEGQNQDFIDKLNTELFGSKKFNFDSDRFREQVRKQKSFGLTEQEVIAGFEAAKKLTKVQKALISEVFAETAETDKIAKELQEAFKQLAKGEKPKSVLKRLSVSNVTQLVNALKDALTYQAVSNDQLDKMADFIVDSIDLSKADQYVNAMVSNSVADVRQLLRAKLIVALQKSGNKDLATQLIKDLADEATQSGRQTQSLKRAYEILGAQGNPATRTEFARMAAEKVQQKAAQMTQAYANAVSEKEAEIGRLNERLHQKAQASPLITKIKDVISTLCGLRNKSK